MQVDSTHRVERAHHLILGARLDGYRPALLERLAFEKRVVFEHWTPAAKRRYGYYVLPILERDRFVGRLDPRHDRSRGALIVDAVWWEHGVRPTAARKRALDRALEKLASRIGATCVQINTDSSAPRAALSGR